MIGFYYDLNSSTKVAGIHSIEFDATLDEAHDWTHEVTQNPVETGAPVTDHVYAMPDKLRLTGVITNSPLRGELAGQYFGGASGTPRIQTAFEAIRETFDKRETVTVFTRHAIYRDMVIQSVTIPRNAGIGEEVQFTMELIGVRFVETQLVELPPGISAKKSASTVGKKAEPQKYKGKTEVQDLSSRYPAPNTSIAKSLLIK